MEILKAKEKNTNFYYWEDMLYSKTGIEICYVGPYKDNNDTYSFYDTGCRNIYQTEKEKIVSYYANDGQRLISYKETRPEYFDKTILLPVKNGVLLNFINKEDKTTYAFKSIHGKKFISTNYKEVVNFMTGYDKACEQVF